MENSSAVAAVPNPDLDSIPAIDDQELYDWGIEHRLDQYYGSDQQPHPPPHHQYQYQSHQPQINNNSGGGGKQVGYILPEHVQDTSNNYMVISEADQKPPKIPGQTLLPMNPIPPGQILVKSETNKTNKYKQPPPIKPNGVPGRRPMLPTVDMDANELLKVSYSISGGTKRTIFEIFEGSSLALDKHAELKIRSTSRALK